MNHIRRRSKMELVADVLLTLVLVVAFLGTPVNATAGDIDGLTGLKFKIYEDDNYVPPGDNSPVGNSTGPASSVASQIGRSTNRVEASQSCEILSAFWAWFLEVTRRL